MRFLFLCFVFVVLACSFSGCGAERRAKKKARREELIALMHGVTPDPEIKAAMEKAQATIEEFLTAIKNPKPNQKQFLVRKKFPATESGQQILWVIDVTYDGAQLHGVVKDNTLKPGSGIATTGKVSFAPNEVVDWMFNEDGKAVGGFTLRALKEKMTPEEWEGMAREIEFKDEGKM